MDGSESIDELGLSVALCSLELAAPLASRRDCMILDMGVARDPFPAFSTVREWQISDVRCRSPDWPNGLSRVYALWQQIAGVTSECGEAPASRAPARCWTADGRGVKSGSRRLLRGGQEKPGARRPGHPFPPTAPGERPFETSAFQSAAARGRRRGRVYRAAAQRQGDPSALSEASAPFRAHHGLRRVFAA